MEFARTGHRRTGGDRRSGGRQPRSTVTTGLPREHGSVRTARSRNPVPTAGLRRVLPAVLLVATAALLAGAGAATPPAGDTVAGTHGGNATGTVEELTVNTTFVGSVADEGRVSVTAHGVTGDDGDPVSGERVTVTVGGDPVTTAAVENGSLETTFDPTVLDLDPGTDATVALHGFDAASTTTVGIVHEVLGLDAGYNRHSVPQAATISVEDVAAVDVWNASAGRYEAVTDPVFDTPTELHRGLYVLATADGARLGYTFETAANPVPGVVSLEPGWNFVGSNYDIAGRAEQTVQADLVGVDAAAHDLFTADLATPLEPGDAVGPFDSYWAFVEGTAVERGILPTAYDAAERAETLGVGTSEFAVVDTNATRRGTDDGTIAVTATIPVGPVGVVGGDRVASRLSRPGDELPT